MVDDLILAGIGIGGFDHTTLATLKALQSARVAMHLTRYHRQLKRYCAQVIDLASMYWTGEADEVVYMRLADRILQESLRGPRVVFIGEGHPFIYDDALRDVCERGRRRGLRITILPAISSLDAMAAYCDLPVDATGLQIVEATALVANRQRINPDSDLLIMQIGWFGTFLLYEVSSHRPGRFYLWWHIFRSTIHSPIRFRFSLPQSQNLHAQSS